MLTPLLDVTQDKLKDEFGGDVGSMLKKEKDVVHGMMELIGIVSYERACVVLNHCLRHLTDPQGITAASSVFTIATIMSGDDVPQHKKGPTTPRGGRRGTAASVSTRASVARGRLSLAPRRQTIAGILGGFDEKKEKPSFFSPTFVSQFGHLVDSGCKGKFESHGAFQVQRL